MADTKITSLLTPQVTTNPATDVLPIVNIADTSMASSGSTRKITVNTLLGAGGTATLASATITGDLTVDTSTLKVDSANNRVGIGTASPAETLTVAGKIRSFSSTFGLSDVIAETTASTGTGYARLIAKTADREWRLINDASTSGSPLIVYDATANAESLRIATAGVYTFGDGAGGTRMTLNSTGLGVGASPAAKLDVNGNVIIRDTFNLTMGFGNQQRILAGGGSDNTFLTFSQWTGAAYTERMRIDQSGNVGIGVTPSAWATTYKALQVSSVAGLSCNSGSAEVLLSNNYFRAASQDQYITTNFATIYQQVSGSHRFYTAPSGTAGNAITFTQAMTLDASGRLLVGPTSANASGGILQLSSGITFPATQVLSSDANTLDDYEEGTFTPTIIGTSTAGTGTYSAQYGTYTKVGRLVSCQIFLNWTAHTGTGDMRISGLPFQVSGASNYFAAAAIGYLSNVSLSAGNIATGYAINATSVITLGQYPTGGGAGAGIAMDTSGEIIISVTYNV